MNIFQKKNLAIWILAILLVVSLSALGTMIFHRACRPAPEKREASCPAGCSLLTKELGLDDKQAKQIEQIREEYRNTARITADSLRDKRMAIVTELGKPAPDTALLRVMAGDIGRLHALLINQTVDQYFRISRECSPEQREKLSSLYYELMGCCQQGEGPQMRERCRGKGR